MSTSSAGKVSLGGAVLVYLLVALLVSVVDLGVTGMVAMEGMVVDGAQHMAESGDLVVPRVYDEVYTYKPALCYWLAMTGLGPSGRGTPFSIRLPFALTGVVMGLIVLLLVADLMGPRIGLLAGTASITSVLFLQKLRIAEYDVPVAAGVGIAVAAASWNLARDRDRFAIWLLAYVALTAGFLAKGAPALLLFGPGLLLAALLTGGVRRLFGWRHLTGALVFVILAAGYLVLAVRSGGMEVFDQPLFEARQRGLGWTWGGFGATLLKPLDVFAIFLPWTVALPFCYTGRNRVARSQREKRLLWCATAFLATGVLAFMITPVTERRYYLPLAVAVGILAALGSRADAGLSPAAERWRWRAAYSVAALTAVATLWLALILETSQVGFDNRVTLGALGLGLLAALVTVARKRPREQVAVALLVASLGVWAGESFGLVPRRAALRCLEPVAEALAPHVRADERVWVLGPAVTAGKNASLYYHLDRPVRAFRLEGELPPPGSLLILTPAHLEALQSRSDFGSASIAQVEHPFDTFLLARLER